MLANRWRSESGERLAVGPRVTIRRIALGVLASILSFAWPLFVRAACLGVCWRQHPARHREEQLVLACLPVGRLCGGIGRRSQLLGEEVPLLFLEMLLEPTEVSTRVHCEIETAVLHGLDAIPQPFASLGIFDGQWTRRTMSQRVQNVHIQAVAAPWTAGLVKVRVLLLW